MEHVVLNVLRFDMGSATSLTFLDPLFTALNLKGSERIHHLAEYYSELTLLDSERFLPYLPSVTAAACLAMSLHAHGLPPMV